MELLTKDIYRALLRNARVREYFEERGEAEPDFLPVVKLFTPDGPCCWLLTELDPEEPDIAYGLCDLGMGTPEFGSVRISELASARGPMGLRVERDRGFIPTKTVGDYADEALSSGHIRA